MQSLLIYDNTGAVVTVLGGITTVPAGVQSVVADVPYNAKSIHVNPQTKAVTYELHPDTESEVTNVQNALIDLEARVAELEG